MDFGTRRGVARFCVLATALAAFSTSSAQAGIWPWGWASHTIPRETPAMDYQTGSVMMAPPIPYGEYAKDYVGTVHEYLGRVCGLCHGAACGLCGGQGLFNGHACQSCGGDGCPRCNGNGHLLTIFGHGAGATGDPSIVSDSIPVGSYNLAGGHGLGHSLHSGLRSATDNGIVPAGAFCGPGQSCASSQGGIALPSSQASCGACGGKGLVTGRTCGLCGGRGILSRLLCNRCSGAGCGACGGQGLVDPSNICSNCGGRGCNLCQGKVCSNCGGHGCKLCRGLGGLLHGGFPSLLGMGNIRYFVGAGGPVPLTPGYVPYVVTTRSPRDYFAFPPFNEQTQP